MVPEAVTWQSGRMTDTDTTQVPRLVNDVFRGWIALSITVTLVVIAQILTALTIPDVSVERLTWSALFLMWGILAVVTTVLIFATFGRATPVELRTWLAATTPQTRGKRIAWAINGGGAVSWAITGSFLAVGAVVVLTFNERFRSDAIIVWPAVGVVIGSFVMMITAYAVRYARENVLNGGAEFPGTAEPRFTEYVYLAIQVATTFGGSDVEITRSAMRRVVSVHSLFAFAFSTVIVALLVSVLISSIS